MSGVKPWARADEHYIEDGDMDGDITGAWLDCSDVVCAGFHVEWSAFALTAGTLSVEGTNDPTQVAFQTMTISVSHGTFPTVGATAAGAIVLVQNPPRFVRLKYTRTAGGTMDQMNAWTNSRSA